MTLTFDLLTSKSIGRILDSWWVSVWSFMIIGWLQSQLSSGNHFQITMRHDLDLWPFDLKINRAHPWLMVSKCMKFHDHRLITESVIVRKPFSNNHAPWPWPLTSKSIGRILDSWWVSVWSFMIIGWLQSQLSSGNHFQITMRHDLDLWPFDPKINRAHPWLMGSKCMKFHDHRWITESVIVRKLVWRTDRQTDWRTDWWTDRVQTYSPLRFHRWGTNNHVYSTCSSKLKE